MSDVIECWKYLPPVGCFCYILFFFFTFCVDVFIGNIQICLRLLCVLWVSLCKNEPTDFFTSECLELKLPAEDLPASTSHHTTARAFTELS